MYCKLVPFLECLGLKSSPLKLTSKVYRQFFCVVRLNYITDDKDGGYDSICGCQYCGEGSDGLSGKKF